MSSLSSTHLTNKAKEKFEALIREYEQDITWYKEKIKDLERRNQELEEIRILRRGRTEGQGHRPSGVSRDSRLRSSRSGYEPGSSNYEHRSRRKRR